MPPHPAFPPFVHHDHSHMSHRSWLSQCLYIDPPLPLSDVDLLFYVSVLLLFICFFELLVSPLIYSIVSLWIISDLYWSCHTLHLFMSVLDFRRPYLCLWVCFFTRVTKWSHLMWTAATYLVSPALEQPFLPDTTPQQQLSYCPSSSVGFTVPASAILFCALFL